MPLKRSLMLILLALNLNISIPSLAQNQSPSQSPAPSPSKASKPPQNQSQSRDQKASPNKQQTTIPPIVVNVLPPQKTQEEFNRDAKAQENKSSSDWWMVIFNGLLTLFTLCLVGIGAWQGAQNKKAADAALKSAETAQANLIATHRPKIIVRSISIRTTHEIEFVITNTGIVELQ